MLNELYDVYNPDGDTPDLALQCVGAPWAYFKQCIQEQQFNILNAGLNLILISYPDSLLPVQINEVFIDERIDLPQQKIIIWGLIIDNIMELLTKFGFRMVAEYVDLKYLGDYITLADLAYTLPGYEDTVGLIPLLESQDITPKDRILGVITKLHGEDYDLTHLEYVVDDVSMVFIKALVDGIKGNEDYENPPQPLIDRVIANKPLLADTLAWHHITANGQLGGSLETILGFFKAQLHLLQEGDPLVYARNVISLYLISELNNDVIKDQLHTAFDNDIDDITARFAIDGLVNGLVLTPGVTHA